MCNARRAKTLLPRLSNLHHKSPQRKGQAISRNSPSYEKSPVPPSSFEGELHGPLALGAKAAAEAPANGNERTEKPDAIAKPLAAKYLHYSIRFPVGRFLRRTSDASADFARARPSLLAAISHDRVGTV
jgi:hypothetical protein